MTDTRPTPARISPSTEAPIFRSTDMHLINEALARAHCTERLSVAERERQVRHVVVTRRLERRAARAAQRARRLAAAAVAMSDRAY